MIFQANAVLGVERAIAIARDAAFVFGLVILGWKGRSWFQPIFDFFKRATGHMDKVEAGMSNMQAGMKTLLENHMHHAEKHLKTLAAKVNQDAVRKQSATGIPTRASRKTRSRKAR